MRDKHGASGPRTCSKGEQRQGVPQTTRGAGGPQKKQQLLTNQLSFWLVNKSAENQRISFQGIMKCRLLPSKSRMRQLRYSHIAGLGFLGYRF